MTYTPDDEKPNRAVLAAIQLPGMTSAEVHASLDELERLANTLGLVAVGRVTQGRPSTQAITVFGPGKLRELAAWTGGTGVVPRGASKRTTGSLPNEEDETPDPPIEEVETAALEEDDGEPVETVTRTERADVVIIDHDLSPTQLRNLEGATGAEVHDRSSVILTIFQRHARTREAKLQVEIARLNYLAPRMRATGGSGERQRGGIGGKGAGESSLELDRRKVRDRIAELKHLLVAVQQEADTRRNRRGARDRVALVGYTNAGKSSLMRALTGTEVLVKDQLFATLDTTVRPLEPRTKPVVFLSDTVGFIKKLPHDLVASFRSTLEEARDAALLLFVVDASDAEWRSQLHVTRQVIAEIGADAVPSKLLFNKADRLDEVASAALTAEFPDSIVLSAHNEDDVERLHATVVGFFEQSMVETTLTVPYKHAKVVNTIHESCRVLDEQFDEEGAILTVRAPQDVIDEIKRNLDALM